MVHLIANALFDLPTGVDDRWMILRTRSRQEKVIAADLSARNIRHFLPLIRSIRYQGRRKNEVDAPLFAGYLFLRGSLDQAYELDRAGRVASILPVSDQITLNSELVSLWIAVSRGITLNPYNRFVVGRWVEVRAGPLRGMRGRIESRKNDLTRLVLSVEMLGRAVSLEIDSALLELLH